MSTATLKERVTFSIDVNLSKEEIKFVDVSSDKYTFCLAAVEKDAEPQWEGNPATSDWISVSRDRYYVIKARPGDFYQYQKIAQIVLTEKTFRVKEVDTPPNTLFMTVEQNKEDMMSIVNKIDTIAQNSKHRDTKQVLVFAEDPFYTNLPSSEQSKCVWKDFTFEIDVKNCTITFVKEEDSRAVLTLHKGENTRGSQPPVLLIDLKNFNKTDSHKNPNNASQEGKTKLERHEFYTLYIKRDEESPDVPVILFKITDKTAIIRELPATKPPVFLSYQKGYEPK